MNQNAESAWGGLGDGGPSTLANVSFTDDLGLNGAGPQLTIGPDGSLFFADGNRIRRVTQPSLPAQIGLSARYSGFDTNHDFDAQGGTRQFQIRNIGIGAMAWTARAETSTGGNWISLPAASGNAGDTLSVQGSVKGLADGFYEGSVYIDAPNASNSPERIDLIYEDGPSAPLAEVCAFHRY